MKAVELRARDGTILKRCIMAEGQIPDVVVDVQPDGAHTIYHQVSNEARCVVYVESVISFTGVQHEGPDRGEVPGEQADPPPA